MVKAKESEIVIDTKFPKSWDTYYKLDFLAREINTFIDHVDKCNLEDIVNKSGYIERIMEAHPELDKFYSANINEYRKIKSELNDLCICKKGKL